MADIGIVSMILSVVSLLVSLFGVLFGVLYYLKFRRTLMDMMRIVLSMKNRYRANNYHDIYVGTE